MSSTFSSSFRGDIQGLRALAVLSVVIFHFGPSRLPGGFIGVDIFFVISGYLIIGHIWRDLNNDTFTLLNFYSRRIQRLFPAFFATIIVTSIGAYFILLPVETVTYAKSLISSIFYASNIFFYSEMDYFNEGLLLSPLLHTWSLSVEEQLYLLLPLILIFIYKKFPRKIILILVSMAILSLLLSELLIHTDKNASFYLSPSRFWQFLVGGIIFIHFNRVKLTKLSSDIISFIGLSIIFYCLFFFNKHTLFPGINALLPTLATAFIIFSGTNTQGYIYQLLSHSIAKFFGNISYSLYLWHWPVLVFYKLSIDDDIPIFPRMLLFIISIILGYLSWKYIENNTWKNSPNSFLIRKPLSTSLLASLTIFVFSLFMITGLSGRYSEQQIQYASYIGYKQHLECLSPNRSPFNNYFSQSSCISYKEQELNTLLIGDSHAGHWYHALHKLLDGKENLSLSNASGCRPTLAYSGEVKCSNKIKWIIQDLLPHYQRFDKIILSARWENEDVQYLPKTIKELKKYTDNVIILGPIIEYDRGLPRLLAQYKSKEQVADFRMYDEIKSKDNLLIKGLSKTTAKYISVLDIICPTKDDCTTTTKDNIPVQHDYGHLTHFGAMEFLTQMKQEKLL